jgi:uncharacterized protein YjbJ (UPF0337 family)
MGALRANANRREGNADMRKVVIAAIAAALLAQATPVVAQGTPTPAARTWDAIAGNWKRLKGSVKRQWGRLTHDDIAEANGRRDALAGKIQARYGIDKTKADAQIDAWLKAQK